ncbi:MAG TPA: hypothetical protein EYP65_07350 [Armatimonadetes bacterium]|nr:hypothetical protein [Armatimonadota bacterium]
MWEEAQSRLAVLVSVLLHPAAVAVALFLLLTLCYHDNFLATFGTATFFVLLAPVGITALMRALGGVSDLDITDRRERLLPYALITACYLGGAFSLRWAGAPREVVAAMACYFTVTAVCTVITAFWKISMHMAGIAGPVVVASLLLPKTALLSILLIPLVAWARLVLRRHTPSQIAGGAAVSALVTFLTLLAFGLAP